MSRKINEIDIGALSQPVYEALGKGLSAFSGIESSLALIFGLLVGCRRHELGLVAFDAINLTSPKLRVLRAVAKYHFDLEASDPASELNYLNNLLKRVEARADFRVKLAHWTVSIWHPEMPIVDFDERVEARLLPPWFSAKNLYFSPAESISLADIEAFTSKCYAVNGDLIKYHMRMQATGLNTGRPEK